jgi:hypothetical protein
MARGDGKANDWRIDCMFGKKKEKPPECPLRNEGLHDGKTCIGTRCEWYIVEEQACAIVIIARNSRKN